MCFRQTFKDMHFGTNTMWGILYIKPLDDVCIEALKRIPGHNDVHIVDVTRNTTHPEWVTGVPTVLDIHTKLVYRGTECLLYLQNKNTLI